MKLNYDVTLEDTLQFFRFHIEHSPTSLQTRARAKWFWGVIIIVVGLFTLMMDLSAGRPPFISALFAVMLVWLLLTWNRTYRKAMMKQGRRICSEGSNRTTLGAQELETVDDGLIARNFYVETKYYWRALERIAASTTHTFVYISATNALVIPHAQVSKTELDELIGYVRMKMSETPPYAPPPPGMAIARR